jgi:hypothetical protein
MTGGTIGPVHRDARPRPVQVLFSFLLDNKRVTEDGVAVFFSLSGSLIFSYYMEGCMRE